MKKSLESLKSKFGAFEMSKEQVKKITGGSDFEVDRPRACAKICSTGGCEAMWGSDGEGAKRCSITCGC